MNNILPRYIPTQKPYIGIYWWTFEDATKEANEKTVNTGYYFTAIKGEPFKGENSEECWAITNKYSTIYTSNRS